MRMCSDNVVRCLAKDIIVVLSARQRNCFCLHQSLTSDKNSKSSNNQLQRLNIRLEFLFIAQKWKYALADEWAENGEKNECVDRLQAKDTQFFIEHVFRWFKAFFFFRHLLPFMRLICCLKCAQQQQQRKSRHSLENKHFEESNSSGRMRTHFHSIDSIIIISVLFGSFLRSFVHSIVCECKSCCANLYGVADSFDGYE